MRRQLSAESICGCFTSKSKQASCNYGIGYDGRVSLCVEEKNRSWCSSSKANDQRAITIEYASDGKEPYAFNDKVYQSLIRLCADICKRNGKNKLLWLGSKDKTLSYQPKPNEMVLTVHRRFAKKSCPGDWLYSRLGDLAEKVNAALKAPAGNTGAEIKANAAATSSTVPYKVKVSIPNLRIRKGLGTNYAKTRKFTGTGVFTITEIKSGSGSAKG